LPPIPSLPQRAAAESMLGQAIVGVQGVALGPRGALVVDARKVDPGADVVVDIGAEAFGGVRAFLDAARGWPGPVKWQLAGPITLGRALLDAGAPASVAFEVAVRAVRQHVVGLGAAIGAVIPASAQVVVIDEPG